MRLHSRSQAYLVAVLLRLGLLQQLPQRLLHQHRALVVASLALASSQALLPQVPMHLPSINPFYL